MKEATKQKIEACVWVVVFAIVLMLTSCSPKVIYVPEVHTDSIYITKHQKDSVWLHDSILVTEKGDTIRVEKWHTKYIERQVHDTCFVTKTDSVAVPYPVKEKLTIKDKFHIYLQCMGIVLGILLVFIVIWLVTKWRHKQIVS